MEKIKLGVIGCGSISNAYFKNCSENFDILDIKACSDLDLEKAKRQAEKYNIPIYCTNEEILNDPEISIVLNLTVPKVHKEVSLQILNAGKHVYSEKPLGVTREEAREVLDLAKQKNLLVGCAPDTFMGAAFQTSRKLIDDGFIGRLLSATGFWLRSGPEQHHPNPFFFYEEGAGPMVDIGVYYISVIISLLGPVKYVTAVTSCGFAERVAGNKDIRGKKIPVSVPTHITGILEFENGANATIISSFDIFAGSSLPAMEIYGTEGTIQIPNPVSYGEHNSWGGKIYLRHKNQLEATEMPIIHCELDRGAGVADLAYSILSGRKPRANSEFGYHVLDVMLAFFDSAKSERKVKIESTCERPSAIPTNLLKNTLDA